MFYPMYAFSYSISCLLKTDTLPDNWLVFLNLPVPPRRRLDLEAANAARDKGEGGDVSSARSGDSSFGAVFSFDPSSGSLAVMNEGVRGGARTHATASSTAVVVGQEEGMDMPNVLGGGGGAEAAPAGPPGGELAKLFLAVLSS